MEKHFVSGEGFDEKNLAEIVQYLGKEVFGNMTMREIRSKYFPQSSRNNVTDVSFKEFEHFIRRTGLKCSIKVVYEKEAVSVKDFEHEEGLKQEATPLHKEMSSQMEGIKDKSLLPENPVISQVTNVVESEFKPSLPPPPPPSFLKKD